MCYVRLTWVDLVAWTRYRVIPISSFKKLLENERPGVRLTEASLGLVFIHLAEGFQASGEYLYVVDPSSMRICPYAPGHASVMGWFERAIPVRDSTYRAYSLLTAAVPEYPSCRPVMSSRTAPPGGVVRTHLRVSDDA